jgi:ATP-dependent DNA helicase RecG
MTLGAETETLEFKKITAELTGALNLITAILNKHNKEELYFGVLNDGTLAGQTVSGVAKIRVADEDLSLSPLQLAEYMRQRNEFQNSWESHISDFFVEQADESTVRNYIKRGREAGRITFEYTDKKTIINSCSLQRMACCSMPGWLFSVQTVCSKLKLKQIAK